MNQLNLEIVNKYVEDNVGVFHENRLESLKKQNLKKLLKRKNPYLFRAKHILKAQDLVEGILSAHLSSSEEGIFGNFLEGLAIFISSKFYGGWKSGIPGIDLEFKKEGIRYIVSIKSGPNWGNSRQIAELKNNFNKAIITIRTSGSSLNVIAVNGCCYGRDNKPDKGSYFKYCGQRFWEFISDDSKLYNTIVKPLGYKAKVKNDEYKKEFAKILNLFTQQFIEEFCIEGEIQWERIVQLNSSK